MKREIVMLGHFGGNKDFYDGQTIKTKVLYDEIKKHTGWEINIIDTFLKNEHPIYLLINSVIKLTTTKDVIVLLSGNGMRFYFPLLYMCSKYLNRRIYHDVIGGNLDVHIKNNPKFLKYLKAFKVNWVESESLKKRLNDLGLHNCEVIPNFKRLNCISKDKIQNWHDDKFRFCTFSRVMYEKGIEDAIDAIEHINEKNDNINCTLDIYGAIDDNYGDRFKKKIDASTPAITYRGVVPYNNSVEAIKDYSALLFPTFWRGEGFPGTIIDAFSAGLPVIASDWNCNKEIIQDGYNGILYPNDKYTSLEEAVGYLINNPDKMIEMKANCLRSAKEYMPDKYIEIMISEIESNYNEKDRKR